MEPKLKTEPKMEGCTCSGDVHIVRGVTCSKCSRPLPRHGLGGVSFSRKDGQTIICSGCGAREALQGEQRTFPGSQTR